MTMIPNITVPKTNNNLLYAFLCARSSVFRRERTPVMLKRETFWITLLQGSEICYFL